LSDTGLKTDGDGRSRPGRRLCTVAALAAASVLAGCGAQHGGASEIARPVAPPALVTAPSVPASPATKPRKPASESTGGAQATKQASAGRPNVPTARKADGRPRILSPADRASFDRLASSLSGQEGLAVSAIGVGRAVERIGSIRSAVAWSTSKVPVAMAVMAGGGAQAQQDSLSRAITASDNVSAERLWSSLGGGQTAAAAADEQLRAGGDSHTQIEYRSLRGAGFTPFGQTNWALSDQVRFTAGLPCSQAGAQALGLMNDVVAGQRWGLGAAGVEAQLKGGWGPGSRPGVSGGYLDRQMGVMVIHGKPPAVTIAAQPADGSHGTGTRNLTAIARWVVAHADVSRLPALPDC
jgi:hypothetical protein